MKSRAARVEVRRYYETILPFYEKESIAGAHLRFWLSLVRHWRPSRILDVGAGLGRITNAVGRYAPAVGIDISLDMLQRAACRLAPGSCAHFAVADMRDLPFGCRFGLIIASSDPFCHLTVAADRRRALRAVAGQLSEDGRFVLDGLCRRRAIFAPPPRRIRHADGILSISETWRPIGTRQLWHAHYRYRDRRTGGVENVVEASFVARTWDPADIRRLFASCGLFVEALWGDFDRRPFRSGATRLLVVAKLR